ncbi:MAG: hypothetical protein HQL95_15560, partial [Magnetococcales bacterium]|nr:hypothetical protein [Magnetococcales bacterium]
MSISFHLPLSAASEAELQTLAATTAEPELALRRMADFIQALRGAERPELLELLARRLEDPIWRRRLVLAWGNSPYLTHVLSKWPEFLADDYPGENP